jgi:hypothetical protein
MDACAGLAAACLALPAAVGRDLELPTAALGPMALGSCLQLLPVVAPASPVSCIWRSRFRMAAQVNVVKSMLDAGTCPQQQQQQQQHIRRSVWGTQPKPCSRLTSIALFWGRVFSKYHPLTADTKY